MSDAPQSNPPTPEEREAAYKVWFEAMVEEGARRFGFVPVAALQYEALNTQKGMASTALLPVPVPNWQPEA